MAPASPFMITNRRAGAFVRALESCNVPCVHAICLKVTETVKRSSDMLRKTTTRAVRAPASKIFEDEYIEGACKGSLQRTTGRDH
jgi:hypothetical protein